ncbi:MAG: hypothetical protein AAF388_29285, partial [Bacteroidota bacterium]
LTTGQIYEPVIQAAATMTIALPKKGLFTEKVKGIRGELYLGDISVPDELYAEKTLEVSLKTVFAQSDVLRLLDA